MLEFAHSIRHRRRRTSLCKLAARLNLEWGSAVMLDAWHDVHAMWPYASSERDASERFGLAVHR